MSYDVFISYPRTFEQQVKPLAEALQITLRNIYRRETSVFLDVTELRPGQDWEEKIDEALGQARALIVIVTPTLLQSPECCREIRLFAEDPAKFIVPLVFETTEDLYNDNPIALPPGAESASAAEIKNVRATLRKRNIVDFRSNTYQSPDAPAYREQVREIGQAVRDSLVENDRREASKRKSGGRLRTMAIAACVVLAAGVGGFLLMQDEPNLTLEEAQRAAFSALADASQDGMQFDAGTGALSIAAPYIGAAPQSLSLNAETAALLSTAGFELGVLEIGDGPACVVVNGPDVAVEAPLTDGETLAVKLAVAPAAEGVAKRTCGAPGTSWRKLDAVALIGEKSGSFRLAPDPDAAKRGGIRITRRYPGPVWRHDAAPGWLRLQINGEYRYAEEDLVRLSAE